MCVLYTLFIRGSSVDSIEVFFRPLISRIYFSYLSIIHVVNNSLIGLGPFNTLMPTNISDIYSNEIESFVSLVHSIFGDSESAYIKSIHDSGNINSPTRQINAHNTFALFFYYYGFFAIFSITYFLHLILVYFRYLLLNLNQIRIDVSRYDKSDYIKTNDLEFSLPVVSLAFFVAAIPSMLFLSLENYLILIVIALGHLGSFFYKISNIHA